MKVLSASQVIPRRNFSIYSTGMKSKRGANVGFDFIFNIIKISKSVLSNEVFSINNLTPFRVFWNYYFYQMTTRNLSHIFQKSPLAQSKSAWKCCLSHDTSKLGLHLCNLINLLKLETKYPETFFCKQLPTCCVDGVKYWHLVELI